MNNNLSLKNKILLQISNIPTVPIVNDVYVSQLLNEESEKRKKLFNEIGYKAYLVSFIDIYCLIVLLLINIILI